MHADDDHHIAMSFKPTSHKIADISEGLLTLSHNQLQKIFEPLVKDIIQLIAGQVDLFEAAIGEGDEAEIIAILMVGGFSESPYLCSAVEKHFRPKGIAVITPPDAWTAVVRGACLAGISGDIITSRRARCHYGIMTVKQVNGSESPQHADAYTDPYDGETRVPNAMEWFVKKGDAILEGQPLTIACFQTYSRAYFMKRRSLKTKAFLWADFDNDAAKFWHNGLQTVCKLRVQLEKVPKSFFTRETGDDGQIYHRLDYSIVLLLKSAKFSYELRINNRGYGRVIAEFDHGDQGIASSDISDEADWKEFHGLDAEGASNPEQRGNTVLVSTSSSRSCIKTMTPILPLQQSLLRPAQIKVLCGQPLISRATEPSR